MLIAYETLNISSSDYTDLLISFKLAVCTIDITLKGNVVRIEYR